MSGLIELAERLEAAPSGDRDLDADIYEALSYEVVRMRRHPTGICWRFRGTGTLDDMRHDRWEVMRRFTTSMDDAMTLLLDGSGLCLVGPFAGEPNSDGYWTARVESGQASEISSAAIPALAICAAALRARAKDQQQ